MVSSFSLKRSFVMSTCVLCTEKLLNTEQLLSSLGMHAYECGSFKQWPDSMKGRDRIAVKVKPGRKVL